MTFIHTTPWSYYNDFDEKTCDWLEELIRRDCIAPGIVDRRSILEVQPDDLREFRQVHFFAGIGGWSLALRLVGWPDDGHVWTGSAPCQPFSSAGRQKGKEDERHLAPKFASLVWACRPRVLFGEQVASAEVFGKAPKKPRHGAAEPPQWAWLDDLLDRLEAAHYAVGANDLPSASIGAPHIRQRTHFGAINLEWLADADSKQQEPTGDGARSENTCWRHGSEWLADRLGARLEGHSGHGDDRGEPGWIGTDTPRSASAHSAVERMGDSRGAAGERDTGTVLGAKAREHGEGFAVDGDLPVGPEHASASLRGLADADRSESGLWRKSRSTQGEGFQSRSISDGGSLLGGLADAEHHDGRTDFEGWGSQGRASDAWGGAALPMDDGGWPGPTNGAWRVADWLFCRDGKWRPVEARPQQMADGLPVDLGRGGDPGADEGSWGRITESLAQEEIGFPLGKVEHARATRLKGYGNAINPWLAAEFISAFLDALRGCSDELSGQSPLEGFTIRQRDMEDLL